MAYYFIVLCVFMTATFVHCTDDDSSEDVQKSVSRYLGTSYDIMRANPFSLQADPGIGNGGLRPVKLLDTVYGNNRRCPVAATCSFGDDGRAMKQSSHVISIKSFADYQRAIKKSLNIYGQFRNDLINGIAILAPDLNSLREHLSEGTFYVDFLNITIREEAKLDYTSVKFLSDDLASALCDLPDTYDTDDYISFLRQFGTHAIAKLQLVDLSRRRVPVDLQTIFNHLVVTAVTFTGSTSPLSEKLPVSAVTPAMLERIVKEVLKNIGSMVPFETLENVPFVTAVVEIASLVTVSRIQRSSTESCRQLFHRFDKSARTKWVSVIQANLRRALQEYKKHSLAEQPDNTVHSIPWPPSILSQIRAIQSANVLTNQGDPCLRDLQQSILGRGYDLLRADPVGPGGDAAVHVGESLIQFKPCTADRTCREPVRCVDVRSSHRHRSELRFQQPDDYHSEMLNNFVMVQTVLHPIVLENIGILSPTFRMIQRLTAKGGTITDSVSYTTIQEAKLVYSSDDLLLEPRFLSDVCSLPDLYDPAEYVSFLKEYGTHVVVRVRYGNFSSTRSIRYERNRTNGSRTGYQAQKLVKNSVRPIAVTLANITSLLSPYTILQSAATPECRKLASNATRLTRLRRFVDDAMIDYSKEPTLFIRRTTTTTTTLSTITTVLTSTRTLSTSTPSTTTAVPSTTAPSTTTSTIHPLLLLPHGTARGVVRDAESNDRLSDVTVVAQLVDRNFKSNLEKTGSSGEFAVSLPTAPNYIFRFELTGYYTAVMHDQRIVANEDLFLEPVLYINKRFMGEGTASGVIRNAFNGQPEPGVSLHFRTAINVIHGSVVSTTKSSGSGTWSASLPTGHYTVQAVKDGFANMTFTVVVLGGIEKANQNSIITPVIGSEEIRFVLRWGEIPADLDLHIRGPNDGIVDTMHVYFPTMRMFSPDGNTNLDVDDVNSYGPETVTVTKQLTGTYRVCVHDYTNRLELNSPGLPNSGAEVRMYRGVMEVGRYFVPTNRNGTVWTVLEMSGLNVTLLSEIGSVASTGLFDGDGIDPVVLDRFQ